MLKGSARPRGEAIKSDGALRRMWEVIDYLDERRGSELGEGKGTRGD